MKVLQIANGYLGNGLYKNLFAVQEKISIDNTVYVPIRNGQMIPIGEPENVIISGCFSQIDRILFFRKQKKMLRDLEVLNPEQFDVIHAHTLFSAGYAAYQLHKKYDVPYIIAVRNTDVNVFLKYLIHLRKVGIEIMRNAERIIYLSPAYLDCVSEKYIPVRYRDELIAKSIVIPNGIAALFHKNKVTGPKTLHWNSVHLIYVGEISSNKNLELTIQAAERLCQEGTQVTITAVGTIMEEKYEKIIKNCTFLTHIEKCAQEKVMEHLRKADIFVMPSHTETFGLVYAEAMSQGLPVLYTKGQGFDGHFADGMVGYAVSDVSVDDLVNKIKLVISRYDEISANCLRSVDLFDWEKIASQYVDIYEKACRC